MKYISVLPSKQVTLHWIRYSSPSKSRLLLTTRSKRIGAKKKTDGAEESDLDKAAYKRPSPLTLSRTISTNYTEARNCKCVDQRSPSLQRECVIAWRRKVVWLSCFKYGWTSRVKFFSELILSPRYKYIIKQTINKTSFFRIFINDKSEQETSLPP